MPRRNPFEFAGRTSRVRAPHARIDAPAAPIEPRGVDAPSPAPEVPAAPALSAIATHHGALTAVVSFKETLYYVKKGDLVAGRYRVDAVGVDAVEVFDLTLGTILRLTLQSLT
jgi:hypothetical protein